MTVPSSYQQVAIYGLYDPRTNALRYIGKAKNPQARLAGHLKAFDLERTARTHRSCWIRSLLALGMHPTMRVLAWVAASDWRAQERRYIAEALSAGIDLTNTSDGGDAPPIDHRARHLSPEHKAKIAAKAKARYANAPMPAHIRQKIGATVTLKQTGRPLTPQWREHIGAAQRGRVIAPQVRAAVADSNRRRAGWHHTPATIARLQEATQARWEHERAVGIERKKAPLTPERRARLAEAARRRWQNTTPDERRRHMQAANTARLSRLDPV